MDELRPVPPRTYPPAPGWSKDGHRIKAPLEYSRGPEKVWVYGALRVEEGKALTLTSRSRNTKGYLRLLERIEQAVPKGLIYLISDNLTTHKKERSCQGVAGEAPEDRACVHPERGGMAELHRGVLAAVQAPGFSRAMFR